MKGNGVLVMDEQKLSYRDADVKYSDTWIQVLRNQLNIISTSVFLLENDISDGNIIDRQRYLQKIKEAMERINVIVK